MTDQPQQQPVRIQRKRTKGWRMPPNSVYVGRPSKWGNFCEVVKKAKECRCCGTILEEIVTPKEAVLMYQHWVDGKIIVNGKIFPIKEVKLELKGKNLACWCPLDQPCHAAILLQIANS